jgi:hypothetical protein
MPEKIDRYYKVPKGTPVMWVPSASPGKPYRGESPFLSWEDGGALDFYTGGALLHMPNEFEKALKDRGYYGLWFEAVLGFPGIRSVWFSPKRVRKLGD